MRGSGRHLLAPMHLLHRDVCEVTGGNGCVDVATHVQISVLASVHTLLLSCNTAISRSESDAVRNGTLLPANPGFGSQEIRPVAQHLALLVGNLLL